MIRGKEAYLLSAGVQCAGGAWPVHVSHTLHVCLCDVREFDPDRLKNVMVTVFVCVWCSDVTGPRRQTGFIDPVFMK